MVFMLIAIRQARSHVGLSRRPAPDPRVHTTNCEVLLLHYRLYRISNKCGIGFLGPLDTKQNTLFVIHLTSLDVIRSTIYLY